MSYVIRYKDGAYNRGQGFEAELAEATVYATKEEATEVFSSLVDAEIVGLEDSREVQAALEGKTYIRPGSQAEVSLRCLLVNQILLRVNEQGQGQLDGRWGPCNKWLAQHALGMNLDSMKTKAQRKHLIEIFPGRLDLLEKLTNEQLVEYFEVVLRRFYVCM